jgi:hypothetical protein
MPLVRWSRVLPIILGVAELFRDSEVYANTESVLA